MWLPTSASTTAIVSVWMNAADGVAAGDVEQALDEVLASYPGVEWNDRTAYIAREIGQIEQFLGVVAGLVGCR